MLDLLFASLFAISAENAETASADPVIKDTLYCREVLEGYSASQSIKICRTKASWRRWEACNGSATRYCDEQDKVLPEGSTVGKETAFPLEEGARIVCRMMRVTGSRIQQIEACLPQREWDRMWKDAAALTARLQEQLLAVDNQEPGVGRR